MYLISLELEPEAIPTPVGICPHCKNLIFPIFEFNSTPANSWVGEQSVSVIQCPDCGKAECEYESEDWQITDSFCLLEEKELWIK